jgi:hypothetical protein
MKAKKTLDELRNDMNLTRCPKCGEPFDISPCSRGHEIRQQIRIEELTKALKGMFQASDEIAAEFIAHKRATNWLVVNEAYLQGKIALTQFGGK